MSLIRSCCVFLASLIAVSCASSTLAAEPKLIARPKLSGILDTLSPDGVMAAGSDGSKIEIANVETGKLINTLPIPVELSDQGTTEIAFSRDGKRFAAYISDPTMPRRSRIEIWDTNDWKSVRSIVSDRLPVYGKFTLSKDASRVLVYQDYGGKIVSVWDVASATVVGTIRRADEVLNCFFTPDDDRIVVIGHDRKTLVNSASLYAADKLETPLKSLLHYYDLSVCLAVRSAGPRVAFLSKVKPRKAKLEFIAFDKGEVEERSFAVDHEIAQAWRLGVGMQGDNVAIASYDRRTVYVYDVWKGTERFQIPVPEQAQHLMLNVQGTRLMIGHTFGHTVWDLTAP